MQALGPEPNILHGESGSSLHWGAEAEAGSGLFLVRKTLRHFNSRNLMNTPLTRPAGIRLSLRTNATNPDHHLWNNNGTWWCHLTLHTAQGRKHRVRCSLKTPLVEKARKRRDALLARLGASVR